uniref:Uncharacterized protein n=1 Tax=Tanacetum cinerariifolium TaxID=118510 RepID=A0A6L2MPD2_TANCI|nr:hypothetical protein [Tanacetum cinerariifolium]
MYSPPKWLKTSKIGAMRLTSMTKNDFGWQWRGGGYGDGDFGDGVGRMWCTAAVEVFRWRGGRAAVGDADDGGSGRCHGGVGGGSVVLLMPWCCRWRRGCGERDSGGWWWIG